MDERDAILGFVVAFAVAALLTPVTSRIARRTGFVDQPKARGLGAGGTPVLGGVAMLAALLVAGALFLDPSPRISDRVTGILLGAVVIAVVGAIDDRFDLHPALKLLGQILAAWIPVHQGVEVDNFTLLGAHAFGDHVGAPVTIAGLVVIMNIVNLSDGIDGLAAGVCTISAATFAVIAFDLDRGTAGVLAAITSGLALGFLIHNFAPASAYMGDSGANLLGLLLGCVAVEGAVKTQAAVALLFPLLVLAVPFLDTTFVVLKRLKYKRKPWGADVNHFHHRFRRIGFSERRTVLYLYGWTLLLAGFALALRFVPYSDHHGHLKTPGTIAMLALALVVFAASVYLVYVLEILKLKRRWRGRRPDATDAEVNADVSRSLETGEFDAVQRRP